jgi:hypothetical protein
MSLEDAMGMMTPVLPAPSLHAESTGICIGA